jgi:hypothetical protein
VRNVGGHGTQPPPIAVTGFGHPPVPGEERPSSTRSMRPRFRARMRAQHVVYCRREVPKGTRFPTEVCYDAQGIREMLQTQREDQSNVDQIRRIPATDYVR